VLSCFLACDDPYATASFMTDILGWRLEFASPRDSGDKMAVVRLADADVMLGTAAEQFLPAASRDHRGAGVTVYIRLPAGSDIEAVHRRHAAAGVVTTPLGVRPWGEEAFDAVIAGYRFLIALETGPRSA
jgi:uncharacterized glyoxalase superfamily protein PhnB